VQVKEIAILDYGLGNIFSINESFKKLGFKTNLISSPDDFKNIETLILPGVGAFGVAMDYLKQHHLIAPIKEHVALGKPLIGICLGMQLLFESSTEHGKQDGLGIIKGSVEKFTPVNNLPMRVPHIGWNKVYLGKEFEKNTNFKIFNEERDFYFVHSYFAKPSNKQDVLLNAEYAGLEFCAAVKHNNILGFQFHPENSAQNGQLLIENIPLFI